jgi:hypothetical protein
LKRRGDCSSAPLQFPIGQMKFVSFSVEQEGIGELVGQLKYAPIQQSNQSCWPVGCVNKRLLFPNGLKLHCRLSTCK